MVGHDRHLHLSPMRSGAISRRTTMGLFETRATQPLGLAAPLRRAPHFSAVVPEARPR